jgi:hypothetical protein
MRAQARLNMTEDEKARESERRRLAYQRCIAEETETDRAMRLADRAQRREDIKWSKYIHPKEMKQHDDNKFSLSPPDAKHCEALTAAARRELSDPDVVCSVCDGFRTKAEVMQPIAMRRLFEDQLFASAPQVLKGPSDLHPDLRACYDVSSAFDDDLGEDADSMAAKFKELLLSPAGIAPPDSDGAACLYMCKPCYTSLLSSSRTLLSQKNKHRKQPKQGESLTLHPPRFAIANGLWVGRGLAGAGIDLTMAEKAIISPYTLIAHLEVARPENQKGGAGTFKLTSHSVSYVLNTSEVLKVSFASFSFSYRVVCLLVTDSCLPYCSNSRAVLPTRLCASSSLGSCLTTLT